MLRRVLIANRGEIVCRIACTCRRLGVEHVAVYSEADAGASYLREAAAAVCVGPASPARSYLNIDRLLAAARETGCDAIHPGYGFLSESATFARAVEEAGLTFVGPKSETIAALGDKARAKTIMGGAGVPVVPGSSEATDDPALLATVAREIGFPVLLKPTAGGGGKGMAIIHHPDDVQEAASSAIRLAQANFGDGRLLAERYIARPRHLEVQVFGDAHGNIVHIFERECTLQRRHQKVVEEAPAPHLDSAVREALLKAAVQGAQAIGYRNAGTFEFMLAPDNAFYFLEVNTRLQVEHPVTEEITGIDLVEWQLRVAAGEPLPMTQSLIHARGHAVECRVYAEDPASHFRPAPGRALRVIWPPRLRIESAVENATEITSHYDPMVAKFIGTGTTRAQALAALRQGLSGTRLFGLTTNIAFLSTLLGDSQVNEGLVHTGYIDEHLERLAGGDDAAAAVACAGALALMKASAPQNTPVSPWVAGPLTDPFDRRVLEPAEPLGRVSVRCGRQWMSARIKDYSQDAIRIEVAGREFVLTRPVQVDGFWSGDVDGQSWSALVMNDAIELIISGRRTRLDTVYDAELFGDSGVTAVAPMPGTVVAVRVAEGDHVNKGQLMVVVEAMKMENPVLAPADAVVADVRCATGASVAAGQVLVVLSQETSD